VATKFLLGVLLALPACSLINAYDEVVEGSGTGGGATTSSTSTTGGEGGAGGEATSSAGGGGGGPPVGLSCAWSLGSPATVKQLPATLDLNGAVVGPVGDVAFVYAASQGSIQAFKVGLQAMVVQDENAVTDPGGALRVLDARPLGPVTGPVGVFVTQETGTFANALRVFESVAQTNVFPVLSGANLGFTDSPQSGRFAFVGPAADRFNYAISGRQSTLFRAAFAQRLAGGNAGKQGVVAEASATGPARVRGLVQSPGNAHLFLGALAPEPSRILSVADSTAPSRLDALPFGSAGTTVLDASRDGDAALTSIAAVRVEAQQNQLRLLVGERTDEQLPSTTMDSLASSVAIPGSDLPRGNAVWVNRSTFVFLSVSGTAGLDLRIVASDGRLLFGENQVFVAPQGATIGEFIAVGRSLDMTENGGDLALFWAVRTNTSDKLMGGRLTCVPETGGM
jgi:hypothetical protein